MTASRSIVAAERVEAAILLLRGQKVLLDADLAALYGVETRALVQAVKRNGERFPDDFVFHLTWDEARALRAQYVILNGGGRLNLQSPTGSWTGNGFSVYDGARGVGANVEERTDMTEAEGG